MTLPYKHDPYALTLPPVGVYLDCYDTERESDELAVADHQAERCLFESRSLWPVLDAWGWLIAVIIAAGIAAGLIGAGMAWEGWAGR